MIVANFTDDDCLIVLLDVDLYIFPARNLTFTNYVYISYHETPPRLLGVHGGDGQGHLHDAPHLKSPNTRCWFRKES